MRFKVSSTLHFFTLNIQSIWLFRNTLQLFYSEQLFPLIIRRIFGFFSYSSRVIKFLLESICNHNFRKLLFTNSFMPHHSPMDSMTGDNSIFSKFEEFQLNFLKNSFHLLQLEHGSIMSCTYFSCLYKIKKKNDHKELIIPCLISTKISNTTYVIKVCVIFILSFLHIVCVIVIF